MTKTFYDPDHLTFIQSRAEVNLATIDEYAQMMTDGIEFDPVEAIQDGSKIYVWDGYHRGEAARRAKKLLYVSVQPGSEQDARWLALTANQKHGLRRSQADKRRVVRLALMHPQGVKLSNSEIARHCGVSDKTVAKVREEMELTSEIPKSDTRVGADGREIKTANIGSQQHPSGYSQGSPEYVQIWELEQGVEQWLSTCPAVESKIKILEDIKKKSSVGVDFLEFLTTDPDRLPGPRRKSDVVQACNNILARLQQEQWRRQRAEHIKTLVCTCGQQALEPWGTMDAIRCTACKRSWNSVNSFEGERARLQEWESAGLLCYLCGQGKVERQSGYIRCTNTACKGQRGNMAKFEADRAIHGGVVPFSPPELPPDQIEVRVGTRVQMRGHWSCQRCRQNYKAGQRTWIRVGGVDELVCDDCLNELELNPVAIIIREQGAGGPTQIESLSDDEAASEGEPVLSEVEGWDFTNVTTAEIERDLATLEGDGLPVDSPFANQLREELETRRRVAEAGPQYRQTPPGQPTVADLAPIGHYMVSNYSDYGWGKIISCSEHKAEGYPVYTLSYVHPGRKPRKDGTYGRPDGWINDLGAVDGRIAKLHAANNDEVRIFPDEQSARNNIELRKRAVEQLKWLLWRASDWELSGWLNLLEREAQARGIGLPLVDKAEGFTEAVATEPVAEPA